MAADYPDAAEPCFLNAQTLAHGDIRWPYYLGHLYRNRGDLPSSRGLFSNARRNCSPTMWPRWSGWATSIWRTDGRRRRSRIREGVDVATELVVGAIRLGPHGTCQAGLSSGRRPPGRSAARDPEAAGAHYPLAMAYSALGDQKKAECTCGSGKMHEILPADPLIVELEALLESPQAYESRGIRALDQKDLAGAAALFRKGLALAPASPALRHRLGTALFMLGDVARRPGAVRTVVRRRPITTGAVQPRRPPSGRGTPRRSHRPIHGGAAHQVELSRGACSGWPPACGERDARGRRCRTTRRSSLNANLTEARFGEAMALVQLGRYPEARDRLSEGMKRFPDQAVFSHGLARLLAAAPDDQRPRRRAGASRSWRSCLAKSRGRSTWVRPWRWPWPISGSSSKLRRAARFDDGRRKERPS